MEILDWSTVQTFDNYSLIIRFKNVEIEIDEDMCPICNSKISPMKLIQIKSDDEKMMYILSKCPSKSCGKFFISEYMKTNILRSGGYSIYTLNKSYPKNYVTTKFDEIINNISPNFIEIYNQAEQAEQGELTEICGVGYRKALEFLIKDYCIKNNSDLEEEIKAKLLGKVINEYIENENIKECARRAVWIGNDETHYVRKWEDKEIKDLRRLIDLTINWILTEEKTKEYLNDMPK
ncbi:DUF4145 domain-containing protein [Clostridium botulinum]|uniref:DUF4145 domain-containing protein n=1 Tax=Clostridium botulinum TaxID=1491 RepID=UPI001C9B2A7D|nr:DUF4145 domain-containing protein [Clostridium botulinum]MBY6844861.1 DUF4145 domain-containing protein [Clostridium botulinum]